MKGCKLFIFLIFLSIIANAQSNDPGLPGDDPDVPIDGGIGFLIAAGIVYGAKKLQETKP